MTSRIKDTVYQLKQLVKTIAQSILGYMGTNAAISPMFTPTLDTTTELAAALMKHYSFDLSGYFAEELVRLWQQEYPTSWLHLAVIEALYQGRYKAVSVHQILTLWARRGQPSYHFNMEFESLICSKFPQSLTTYSTPALPPVKTKTVKQAMKNYEDFVDKDSKNTENRAQLPASDSRSSSERSHATTESSTHSIVAVKTPPSPISEKLALLPSALNHPPIEQFTPQTNDRSESFTSKLKAISAAK